eukprot:scaffold5788_cov209-Alexandrium_tamarense.AAC.1
MASQWKYGTTPRNAFFCFHDTTPATHEPLEYEVQKLHRVLALFSVVVSKVPKKCTRCRRKAKDESRTAVETLEAILTPD